MLNLNDLKQKLNEVFETDIPSLHKKLVEMVKKWNGKIYLVGGAVRDEIMGYESKDMDYVVTGIERNKLKEELLKTLPGSKVNEAGANFGIVIVNIGDDQFEFALPRSDIDRDTVKTNPNLSIEEDLLRRDFTINAIAKDLETGKLITAPNYNGIDDIKNKILRTVGDANKRFKEDGLRILRLIQFSARFGFKIDPYTLNAVKTNIDLLSSVSKERFKEEFKKGWVKGCRDTNTFFYLLKETGIGNMIFGKDFNPIPLNIKEFSENDAFIIQNIGAFINGGNFEVVNISKKDKHPIILSIILKDVLENKFDLEKSKQIYKIFNENINYVLNAFNIIDKKLFKELKKYLKTPCMPFIGDTYKSWMLPVKGEEILKFSEENGIVLTGSSIGKIIDELILSYQNKKIKINNDLSKSKEIVKNYLLTNIFQTKNIKDSINLEILKERMRNILR